MEQGKITERDYLPIEWMRKELYEMLYKREISYDELNVYIKLIARWRKETEKRYEGH